MRALSSVLVGGETSHSPLDLNSQLASLERPLGKREDAADLRIFMRNSMRGWDRRAQVEKSAEKEVNQGPQLCEPAPRDSRDGCRGWYKLTMFTVIIWPFALLELLLASRVLRCYQI